MDSPRPQLARTSRERTMWGVVAALVAGLLLALGIVYVCGAINFASPAYAIIAVVPGGFVTHGVALLALGVLVASGLVPPIAQRRYRHSWTRTALTISLAYEAWILYAFAAAWVRTDVGDGPNVTWWLFVAALTIALILRSPRDDSREAECSPRSTRST